METVELIQKDPVEGSREFTLDNDEVHYVINSPLRNDALSVALNVLEPEPKAMGSILAFISQVNKEPLVELLVDNPDKETFDQFVETLQQRIAEEDFSRFRVPDKGVNVNVERLEESIDMLRQHVDSTEIEPLLSAMAVLQTKPKDVQCQRNVADAFNELGFVQGQVLTYAPYITYLLSSSGD